MVHFDRLIQEVAVVDSLKIKPKYLCLEISDRIKLQSQLNGEKNKNVRSYLSNDGDYRIVSQVALVTNVLNAQRLSHAEGVFLLESNNGILGIELLDNNQRTTLDFSELEIFDFKLLGFCWGEDLYGKKEIEAIVSNDKSCPNGTEKDARKLKEINPYLKL